MDLRNSIATGALSAARTFGRAIGCELVVEASDHSLKTTMEVPNKNERAWDPNLYKNGQLYHAAYANPIKPKVNHDTDLETPDTIDVNKSGVATDGGETDAHVQLISSSRYREYMRQDLISQLLNPREQWKILVYVLIGVLILVVANVLISLSAAGAF